MRAASGCGHGETGLHELGGAVGGASLILAVLQRGVALLHRAGAALPLVFQHPYQGAVLLLQGRAVIFMDYVARIERKRETEQAVMVKNSAQKTVLYTTILLVIFEFLTEAHDFHLLDGLCKISSRNFLLSSTEVSVPFPSIH